MSTSNRALWDQESGLVLPYPRLDDELVAGLDLERYQVLTIIRDERPEPAEGFAAREVRSVDLAASEWCWGWTMVEQPAPPAPVVAPDYQGFYQALLISQVYGAVLQQPATADLARALAVFVSAIQDALNGRENQPALQGAIWLLLSYVALTAEHVDELQALMAGHGLGEVYSLTPPEGA